MTGTINIFAKIPQIGLSKTRLAKSVGDTHAKRIANWLFSNTIKNIPFNRWNTNLYISPDMGQERLKSSCNLHVRTQGHGDLGDRLNRALDNSPCGKIVFVGTDTADLRHHHFTIAFRALSRHNLVFGPANDGGFWLMGINKTSHSKGDPFRNVRWSSEHALSDVIANFPRNSSIHYLETLTDIDYGDDWRDWLRKSSSRNTSKQNN